MGNAKTDSAKTDSDLLTPCDQDKDSLPSRIVHGFTSILQTLCRGARSRVAPEIKIPPASPTKNQAQDHRCPARQTDWRLFAGIQEMP